MTLPEDDGKAGTLNAQVASDERRASCSPAQCTGTAEVCVPANTGLRALAQFVVPFVAGIVYYDHIATFYETSGWLPYRTVPFRLHFVEHPKARSEAYPSIRKYYEDSSREILQDIETRVEGYEMDTEAVAVMEEAIQAHRAGLYRSVCRVLLPEIERVIRTDLLHISELISINQQDIRKRLEQQHLRDVVIDSPHDFVLFGIFYKHLFAPVKNNKPGNQFVPNRHAGVHGWTAYSSRKQALNAIICADYVFRLVSSLECQTSSTTRA